MVSTCMGRDWSGTRLWARTRKSSTLPASPNQPFLSATRWRDWQPGQSTSTTPVVEERCQSHDTATTRTVVACLCAAAGVRTMLIGLAAEPLDGASVAAAAREHHIQLFLALSPAALTRGRLASRHVAAPGAGSAARAPRREQHCSNTDAGRPPSSWAWAPHRRRVTGAVPEPMQHGADDEKPREMKRVRRTRGRPCSSALCGPHTSAIWCPSPFALRGRGAVRWRPPPNVATGGSRMWRCWRSAATSARRR